MVIEKDSSGEFDLVRASGSELRSESKNNSAERFSKHSVFEQRSERKFLKF